MENEPEYTFELYSFQSKILEYKLEATVEDCKTFSKSDVLCQAIIDLLLRDGVYTQLNLTIISGNITVVDKVSLNNYYFWEQRKKLAITE